MRKTDSILIIDDNIELCEALNDLLVTQEYDVSFVCNGSDAVRMVEKQQFGLVLLDLLLPDCDGLQVLDRIMKADPGAVVIMMSGHGTIENAVAAVHRGAYDWLEKPLEKERLFLVLRNAQEKLRLLAAKTIPLAEAEKKYGMVGAGPEVQRVYGLIDRVAAQTVSVLITGESGTGKELAAAAIHLNSRRAEAPFVHVNCAAVPETLIEAELFGHKKGAFTGAIADRMGKFKQADGGTLFLDEVGDLSQAAQAKILRAIESGEVEVVGGNETDTVDVRLLTATNRNLGAMAEAGTFRQDLLHRINAIEIHMPPLRSRIDDILPLINHFIGSYCQRNHMQMKRLMPAAEAMLLAHAWPGNVRELRNLAEKIVVLVDSVQVTGQQIASVMDIPYDTIAYEGGRTLSQARRNFEKSFIVHSLQDNDWNISKTAEVLDIHRSSLHNKIRELGIKDMSEKGDK